MWHMMPRQGGYVFGTCHCRDTIAARDKSISERDAEISQIQRQNAAITDRMMV